VRFERLDGFHAPGTPARLNKVGVLEIGSRSARNVLVLNPGTSAGAAYFAPVAKDLVERASGWQVWAVERRENLLEDQSMLDRAKQGTATGRRLFDYYLGWSDRLERLAALPVRARRIGRLRTRMGDASGGRGPAAGRRGRSPRRPAGACWAGTRSAARSRPRTRPGTSAAVRAPVTWRSRLHRRREQPGARSAPRTRGLRSGACGPARRGSRSAASAPRSPGSSRPPARREC
jgi:hypothetical protein